MTMKFKPVLRYELRNLMLSTLPYMAVLLAVVCLTAVLNSRGANDVTFGGISVASAICLFVFGIVEPRPCLRLCAQLGVSRRTAFLSNLISAFATTLLLAVFGEILLLGGRVLNAGGFLAVDLYQMIFLGGFDAMDAVMSLPQHLISILFSTLMMTMAYCFGMFFTYMFWRLNKLWTVVAALCIPLLFNVVPWLLTLWPAATKALSAFFLWQSTSVWNMLLVFVITAALLCVICWLLVRRANIKAPAGK